MIDIQNNANAMPQFRTLKDRLYTKDGILAWFVCIGMFVNNLIIVGIDTSFGEILGGMVEELDLPRHVIAIIGSAHTSTQSFSAFMASLLVKRYGFRLLIFVGGAISCFAFVLAWLSSTAATLVLTYGILGGLGTGLVWTPGIIACSSYFDRKRAFATGLASSGSGAGILVIPFLSNNINYLYGWKSSILSFACLCPIISLVSMIMVQLPPSSDIKVQHNEDNNKQLHIEKFPLLQNKDQSNVKDVINDTLEVPNTKQGCCNKCFVEIKAIVRDIVTCLSLLKGTQGIVFSTVACTSRMAIYISYAYLPDMLLQDHGIPTLRAGNVVPILGAGRIFGSVVIGILANKFSNNSLNLMFCCFIGASISCTCFPFCTQYTTFVILVAINGFMIGAAISLVTESLIEMFGIELLQTSYGCVMFATMIGVGIGPPMGGAIYSIKSNYDMVFYFGGIMYLIAAILCSFLICVNKYH